MASIKDWAAKAANEIVSERWRPYITDEERTAAEEHYAAIIATFAEPLVALLREAKREHFHVEDDTWYCCGACTCRCSVPEEDPAHEHTESCCAISHNIPKRVQGVCDCGAAAWNARRDAALAGDAASK